MDTSHEHPSNENQLFNSVRGMDECLRLLAANGVPLADVERYIRRTYALTALDLSHQRSGKAAELIGVHRNTMYYIVNGRNTKDAHA